MNCIIHVIQLAVSQLLTYLKVNTKNDQFIITFNDDELQNFIIDKDYFFNTILKKVSISFITLYYNVHIC